MGAAHRVVLSVLAAARAALGGRTVASFPRPLPPRPEGPARPIRRLLVTGAAGEVATLLLPALRARYATLRLSDARHVARPEPADEVARCDLADRRAVARALDGCDAVLHLGGVAKETTFERLAPANLTGVQQVLELAVASGVRRVVLASSMHVLGMYGRDELVDAGSPPRPDSLYAVSKLFAEGLARMYAERYGLEVACLRIGHVAPRSEDAEPGNWIAPEDLATLVTTMLEHPDVRYEVVLAVAPHPGEDLGQAELVRRFGMCWRRPGPARAEVLARVAARYAGDPIAASRRGGEFASATRPMI